MLISKLFQSIQNKLRLRNMTVKEVFKEFLGTFLLVAFENAALAQNRLTNSVNSGFLAIRFGWGVGVLLGVMASSGGLINPAATVAMAVVGKVQWIKVPVYLVAQYLGAFVASGIVFAVYLNAFDGFEAERSLETAAIFTTIPGIITDNNVVFLPAATIVGELVVGTVLLLIISLAITDVRNMEVPNSLIPVMVGLTVLTIGLSFGFSSGYTLNPARDFSSRVFIVLAGWGSAPFSTTTVDGVMWWWVPIACTHAGAILGALLYVLLIELHHPEQDDVSHPQGYAQDASKQGGADEQRKISDMQEQPL